jgi:chromosome segregation ATPase
MIIEEITQTLQRVADNQARHDEMHARHSADIAEIDKMIAASLESQNRYDKQLARLFEVVGDLADRQIKNEEIFAELARARERHEVRMGQLEASYELFESFVRDFREETRDHFAETDKRLAELAISQAKTDEQMMRTDERMNRTDEQIKALIAAQTRTDEQIRLLLERNGSTATPRAKVKKTTKKAKKRGAK